MEQHIRNLNEAFGPDRIEPLPATPETLFARINQVADDPFYHGSHGQENLVRNLDTAFGDIEAIGERGIDYLAKLVGYAAWDTGGVDIFGRHWCADHGHRAEPSRASTVPGQVRVAASASVRTVHTISDFEWTVTLHQPCCPRTLSGEIGTATLTPRAAEDWAQRLVNQRTVDDPHLDWGEDEAQGHRDICCCLTEGERPADVLYLAPGLADRYWRLLRDMRFEVRIPNDAHDKDTYDPDDPIPGNGTADLWRLDKFFNTVMLYADTYEEPVGRADSDLTAELTQLIGVLRR